MSNNNVPTGPGFHYRGTDIVRVRMDLSTNLHSGLVYYMHGSVHALKVEDDGFWAGPVPMPGEWVSREDYERQGRELDDLYRQNAYAP